MNHLADYREQITENYQVSDNRQAALFYVCRLLPVKFLPNAACYVLNNSKGIA